jgi:hypothetical protein
MSAVGILSMDRVIAVVRKSPKKKLRVAPSLEWGTGHLVAIPLEGNLSKQLWGWSSSHMCAYFVPTYINMAGHATDRHLSTARPGKYLFNSKISSKRRQLHFALQYANWFHNAGFWGSRRGGCEEFRFLGYNAMYSAESRRTFRRKMEATYSSDTSVDFRRTIRRYISQHSTLDFMMFELFMEGYQK